MGVGAILFKRFRQSVVGGSRRDGSGVMAFIFVKAEPPTLMTTS